MAGLLAWVSIRSSCTGHKNIKARGFGNITSGKGLICTDGNTFYLIMQSNENAIARSTVMEMFDSRDKQIANLAEQIKEMKTDVKETNKLLTQILRVIPRESNGN